VHLAHQVATALAFSGAQAARDDDLAVLGQASPMASRLSRTASSMKPQVLTITRSAPA